MRYEDFPITQQGNMLPETATATADVTGIGNDRSLALYTRVFRSDVLVPDLSNVEPHRPPDR